MSLRQYSKFSPLKKEIQKTISHFKSSQIVAFTSVVETGAKVLSFSKLVVSVEGTSVSTFIAILSVAPTVVIAEKTDSCVVGSVVIVLLEVVSLMMSLFKIVIEASLTISSDNVVDDSGIVKCDIESVVE